MNFLSSTGGGHFCLVINTKEKNIKEYFYTKKLIDTIQIKKETGFWVFGENKKTSH